MIWPWSKPKPAPAPVKDVAAEHAKASRQAAYDELMESLSEVASDAVGAIRDSINGGKRR